MFSGSIQFAQLNTHTHTHTHSVGGTLVDKKELERLEKERTRILESRIQVRSWPPVVWNFISPSLRRKKSKESYNASPSCLFYILPSQLRFNFTAFPSRIRTRAHTHIIPPFPAHHFHHVSHLHVIDTCAVNMPHNIWAYVHSKLCTTTMQF